MTSEQMIHMMKVLFPHMNPDDKEAFLVDIKECQPKKFIEAWQGIQSYLSAKEQETLMQKLDFGSLSSSQ